MCGICGLISDDLENFKVFKLLKPILQRGPDGEGTYFSKSCFLGHRRLSIIDLEGGKQPIVNEKGNIVIICNGEIYNHITLRNKLEQKGHIFKTGSDSEVILHLYEEYPSNFCTYLDGMYAFAIWDDINNKLIIARDPVGIKPLYYVHENGNFIFSSEIKSILNLLGKQPNIDKSALFSLLKWRTPLYGKTLIRNVSRLLPGTLIIYKKNNIKQYRFHKWAFNLKYKDSETSVLYKRILIELEKSVRERLMADVPIGVFLSGGLDSSIISVLASKSCEEPINTFTVRIEENSNLDESPFANLIANQINSNHRVLDISYKDFENLLPDLIWYSDEPILDQAILPTYLMSKVARKEVKVVLTGEGSDELFLGYPRYKIGLLPLPIISRRFKKQIYDFFPPSSVFSNREINQLVKCDWNVPAESKKRVKNLNKNWMIQQDLAHWLPNYLLAKVDRMSMAVGLEARVPFLDKKLVNLAGNIPSHQKATIFEEKRVLKRIFKDVLPRKTIKRRKHPFLVPYRNWFRSMDLETVFRKFSENFNSYGINFDYKKTSKKLFRLLTNPNPIQQLRAENKIWLIIGMNIWYSDIIIEHEWEKPTGKKFQSYI